MFILTGSHQVELHSAVSQSLAGRTSLLRLLPLSLQEMRNAHIPDSLEEIILKGGYPKIYKENLPISNAYSSYFQTYVERDVRQILQVKDIIQFERFIKLTASRIGQLVNYASLASDVGVRLFSRTNSEKSPRRCFDLCRQTDARNGGFSAF